MTECARCREPIFGTVVAVDTTILANTDIRVCRECGVAWVLSVESRRLRAISTSLFNEWVERERCEKIVEREREQLNQKEKT